MLTELRIENFAIIQSLELNFTPGLITFTGETGAGKSIILDALDVLVGGRTESAQIRSGAERATLEAVFTLPEESRAEIVAVLEREDLMDDPNFLSVSREIRREGRSVARVNGRVANQALLRELGGFLVDIHGQSEHLSLLNVRKHIALLDRYAGDAEELSVYRGVFLKLQTARRELTALRQSELDAARRTDLLNYQAQEIESAHLRVGEDEEARQERERLANAESLASLAQQSLTLLDDGSPESPAISDLVGQVAQSLAALSRIDTTQTELSQQAETLAEGLADLSRELRDYQEQIEFNPRRLEQLEERLDVIHNLKRKYGGSIEAALAFANDAREQLETISHAGERIAELEEQETGLLKELAQRGEALSAKRSEAAKTLGEAVELELADLRMAGARFAVDMQQPETAEGVTLTNGQRVAFDETGIDRVEFLIAPNPGEGLKPLVKIASGGETSRLMLALKDVLAKADDIPTLVFDEIDQGIGGRVGMVVGEKLWRLGRRHQVLCVTHLPQLAAFGDRHFCVRKEVQDGRTTTQVEAVEGARRLDELAEMIGNVSDANRSAAQETLEEAKRRAEQLMSSD